jgi:excisionase family DNA binding protein
LGFSAIAVEYSQKECPLMNTELLPSNVPDDVLTRESDKAFGLSRRALSPEQAGEVLGVSRSMIYHLMRTGELRSLKMGRRRVIPVDAIEDLLNGRAA